jgi:hypothetical protein
MLLKRAADPFLGLARELAVPGSGVDPAVRRARHPENHSFHSQPEVVGWPVLRASTDQLFGLEMQAGAVLLAEGGLVFYNCGSTR